jgi:hypothetical protein
MKSSSFEQAAESPLVQEIEYFFLNHPWKEVKAHLWHFYTAWVHHDASIAEPAAHSEVLSFYEELKTLLKTLHHSCEKHG